MQSQNLDCRLLALYTDECQYWFQKKRIWAGFVKGNFCPSSIANSFAVFQIQDYIAFGCLTIK